MIRVVCALIRNDDGKLLLTRRSNNMDHALHWEFPGGKVKAGESDSEAIIREIREELGLEVNPGEILPTVFWEYPGKKIALVPVICEISSGTMHLHEHLDYEWLGVNGMDQLEILGADREIINHLKRNHENKTP